MIDAEDLGIVERKPGEFARHPKTGAPWVADPTKTSKETGKKADLIALCALRGLEIPEKATVPKLQALLGPRATMVQYGRPSGLGKQIEDQTNLQKWSERMVALGIGSDDELIRMAVELADLDHESNEFREAADAIARRAKSVAQAHLAAERGTHHHELTEDVDKDRDPVERMAAGEDLGVPIPVQKALVAAWSAMLATHDIEILATEATCVDDVWRQAGTLDRVCRLRKPLTFITVTGEFVTLPAGWVGILDIKTGKLRLDRNGFVAFWQGYSVQLASYAQSDRYDPDTNVRSPWEWPIDQQWAVIAHLDVLAALDGEAVCRLVLVNLEAGRHAGALCVAGKAWEKRVDVFSIPHDDLAVRVPVEFEQIASEPVYGDEEPEFGAVEIPAPPVAQQQPAPVEPPAIRHPFDDLAPRIAAIANHPKGRQMLGEAWIAAEIPFKPKEIDFELLALEEPFPDLTRLKMAKQVIERVEAALSLPFLDAPVPPDPPMADNSVTTLQPLDEGAAADPAAVAKVKDWLTALSAPMKAAVKQVTTAANKAGGPISLGQRPTVRRFEIARTLVLVDRVAEGSPDDFLDLLDACLATIAGDTSGDRSDQWRGAIIASLDALRATQLAAIARNLADHELALAFDDNGVAYLAPSNYNH